MKALQYIVCIVFVCSIQTLSADDSRGFWGWLTDVTSSAWEGTKNTVNSFFGGAPRDDKKYDAQKEKDSVTERSASGSPAQDTPAQEK